MATEIDLKPPHVGKLIAKVMYKRKIDWAALARAMHKNRTTVWKYEMRQSLQLKILWHLCTVLKHNFFAEIAAQLPADYASNVPPETHANDRIAQLEAENHDLHLQLNLLEKLLKK